MVDWGVTEVEALQYCYERGFRWEENGIPLYEILDRVSCWCCGNKNLKELYNMYRYLPEYWRKLKDLQAKTNRPFRRDTGKTIFDLGTGILGKDVKYMILSFYFTRRSYNVSFWNLQGQVLTDFLKNLHTFA